MLEELTGIKLRDNKSLDVLLRKAAFALLRFVIYGMVGVFAEVCQYSLVRIGRMLPVVEFFFRAEWKVDDRLNLNGIWETPWYVFYGQCSLWMFPVYGLCALLVLERIYKLSVHYRLHFILRGIMYSLAITVFELGTGFILLWLTGYRIWYYSDTGNILTMTSIFLFFVWFVTGMFVEFLYKELMEGNLRRRATDLYEGFAMCAPPEE